MSFKISFSFSLSFSLGTDASCERHLSASDGENNSPLISLSRHDIEPSSVIELPVPTNTPARRNSRIFARHVRKESASASKGTPESKETHIPDTIESKASDRESLQILLDSSKQQDQPTSSSTLNMDTADQLSDSSLVQHRPSMFVSIPSEDPFVSSSSPVRDDDSSSDLESSLQRLRVGGLSSYLREMGRRADLSMSTSSGALVSTEHKADAVVKEKADQSKEKHDINSDSDEWEMISSGQCWKKHRHVRE